MTLKVTVENPDFPKDTVFGINGLGQFVNGKSREVTDEEEMVYLAETGQVAREGLKNNANIKIEGTASVKASALPEISDTVYLDKPEGSES